MVREKTRFAPRGNRLQNEKDNDDDAIRVIDEERESKFCLAKMEYHFIGWWQRGVSKRQAPTDQRRELGIKSKWSEMK